jgi:hypothetical protein
MPENTLDLPTGMESFCLSGASEIEQGAAHSTSCKYGLLVSRNTGTYGNGFEVTTTAHGNSNTGEASIYQIEGASVHPQTDDVTAYISTALAANDAIVVARHEIGKEYWLKGSSLTASLDDKLVPSTNGLVEKEDAHSSSGVSMHTWACTLAVSSGTWTRGIYMGLTFIFTA